MLVVSEVCTRGHGTRRTGEGSTRSEERLVGRSAAGAAVGVAAGKGGEPPTVLGDPP